MEFIRTNCILTFNMYHATIFIFSELILQGKKKISLKKIYVTNEITVHGVLKARILEWFAISFPVEHILSWKSKKLGHWKMNSPGR